MLANRLLRLTNLSIAVLAAIVLCAVYWLAYRPLPQTSGTLTAPLTAPATVTRDALGVPHIVAATWEDAISLQGYVTAQDRLWQMDGIRRLAGGELAEIAGPQAIPLDREARQLRMRATAEAQSRALNAADRAVLVAYARGVNFFIETHRDELPLEFSLPFHRYDPRPWRVVDSLLAGLQMYRNLTTTWPDELRKQNMLRGGDPAKVNLLFTPRTGAEIQPGSNAWAIAGTRTAGGLPILANDPHLEFSVPSTWYMIQLRAPGLNVTGATLPGVPCIIVGHNEHIAWGVTNLHFDVQDLYDEKLDPQTGRYQFRGQTEAAHLEREVIAVRGAKPVGVETWVTRHGPVVVTDQGHYYALRWAAAESQGFSFPFLDLNRARNWTEFTAAIARFQGPGQNFVYAGVDGHIGYHATGRLPIRRNYDGDVPADGSSGVNEWDGFIPFDELPAFYDPPSGMIVTANQNPFPMNYRYRVNGNFASPYRARQIQALLVARTNWRPAEMLAVQKDVYSAFSAFLAGEIVQAYDSSGVRDPELRPAIDQLRGWNGQMEKGTAAPLIASLLYDRLEKAVADRASPDKGAGYDMQMAPAVIENLLRARPKDWFPDFDRLLLACLREAIQAGRKLGRADVSRWDYGHYSELTIRHPVGSQLPFAGKYFSVGPAPMSGSSTTVKQTTRRLGPSMRMIVDLSDLDQSMQNITVGESGQILSSHYQDQWESYYIGRSFPMQFQKITPNAVLTVHP